MANGSAQEDPIPPPPKLFLLPETPVWKRYTPPPCLDPVPTDNDVAIVIDNGSWQLRAGFSTDRDYRFACTPQVARYRDRKALKTYTICGNDIFVDAATRSQAKSPFDGNVVSNFDVLENLLDYTFLKLGVDGNASGGIGKPIVMTEAVCNPNYSRRVATEMLFEAYQVPSVVYGIDALFSYSYNKGSTGLVISSSNTSTHLIPVYNGKGMLPLATRLNWGSTQSSEYLLKLLQLKYPTFPSKLSNWQAEALLVEHCYVSTDYKSEISSYLDSSTILEKDRVIQFPFVETVVTVKTEEELAKIAERKRESGRRLQEQAAKIRLEKLAKKEQDLDALRALHARAQTENKRDFQRMLQSNSLKDENALERAIRDLDRAVKRARKQDVDEEEETPTFPLLDIPDEQLDEAQLKQKKTQRLMKSNWEARQRAKAEKEREKERIAEEERKEVEMRTNDFEGWVRERRAQRDNLKSQIQARERLKADLANRKSLASQLRMKSLANLAADNIPSSGPGTPGGPSTSGGGSGGSGSASSRRRNNPDADDNFGANDEDWAVYRNLQAPLSTTNPNDPNDPNAQSNLSADDIDRDLSERLKTLETVLLTHDPDFAEHMNMESQGDWRNSRMHRFLWGPRPHRPDEVQAEMYQVHLNVERIRVPEPIFQPSMAGVDQAGLVEVAADILLQRLPTHQRNAVLRDVFLTGGNTMFAGFGERVKKELTMVLEWGAELGVRGARDPLGDAWRGAAEWVRGGDGAEEWRRSRVTREEYAEMGGEYIKEHRLGNAMV